MGTGVKQCKEEVKNQAWKSTNWKMPSIIWAVVFAALIGILVATHNKEVKGQNSKVFALETEIESLQNQIKTSTEKLDQAKLSNFYSVLFVNQLQNQIKTCTDESVQMNLSNQASVGKLYNQLHKSKAAFKKVQTKNRYNFQKEVESLENQIKTRTQELGQARLSNEASEKKLRNQLDASKKLHSQHLETVKKEFSKVKNEYFFMKSNYEKEKALVSSLEKDVETLETQLLDLLFDVEELIDEEPEKRSNSNNENPSNENLESNESDLKKWKISKESVNGTIQLINKAKGTLKDFEMRNGHEADVNNQWIYTDIEIVPSGIRKAHFTNIQDWENEEFDQLEISDDSEWDYIELDASQLCPSKLDNFDWDESELDNSNWDNSELDNDEVDQLEIHDYSELDDSELNDSELDYSDLDDFNWDDSELDDDELDDSELDNFRVDTVSRRSPIKGVRPRSYRNENDFNRDDSRLDNSKLDGLELDDDKLWGEDLVLSVRNYPYGPEVAMMPNYKQRLDQNANQYEQWLVSESDDGWMEISNLETGKTLQLCSEMEIDEEGVISQRQQLTIGNCNNTRKE